MRDRIGNCEIRNGNAEDTAIEDAQQYGGWSQTWQQGKRREAESLTFGGGGREGGGNPYASLKRAG